MQNFIENKYRMVENFKQFNFRILALQNFRKYKYKGLIFGSENHQVDQVFENINPKSCIFENLNLQKFPTERY